MWCGSTIIIVGWYKAVLNVGCDVGVILSNIESIMFYYEDIS